MKRVMLVGIILLMGALLIFSACSSDKKTNSAKTQGAANDPSYLAAQAYARAFADSLASAASDGFLYMNFNGSSLGKTASDSESVRFDSTSYWWILYSHIDTTEYNNTLVDSVRFEFGANYQRLPDSLTTTGIDYRSHGNFGRTIDTTSIDWSYLRNFHLTGIQNNLVLYSGADNFDYSISFGQRISGQTYNSSLTGLTFNRADLENGNRPHPTAGTMSLGLNIQSNSNQGTSTVVWAINATYSPGQYAMHFESGNYYWDWSGNYGGGK